MKLLDRLQINTNSRKILLTVVFIFAALFLQSWANNLKFKADVGRNRYATDLELSKNQLVYKKAYEQILQNISGIAPGRLEQNDWIRSVQDLARSHQLLLQELSPVPRRGSGENDLSVVLTGSTENIFEFLRGISQNADGVFILDLVFSRLPEQNSVQAELRLTQG